MQFSVIDFKSNFKVYTIPWEHYIHKLIDAEGEARNENDKSKYTRGERDRERGGRERRYRKEVKEKQGVTPEGIQRGSG